MNIDVVVEPMPSYTLVMVKGEVDLAGAPVLQESLEQLAHDPGLVVIDLADVEFIDSSGLSVLVQASEHLKGDDGHAMVRVVAVRPSLLRILDVTGLSDVLEVFSSRDEAVAGR